MLFSGYDFQIFYPIVGPNMVFVVNRFVNVELPAKLLFHNKTMFSNGSIPLSGPLPSISVFIKTDSIFPPGVRGPKFTAVA